MNKNQIVIEIFLITFLILFAIFWLLDPNGNYEPAIAIAGGGLGLVEFYRRYQKEQYKIEKQTKLQLDILSKIVPNSSIERMKEILGAPHSIKTDREYFSNDKNSIINTTTYCYEYENGIIEFDSEGGTSIDTVSLFKYFNDDVFEMAYINDLGVLTIGDVEAEHGLEGINIFTGPRYAVLSIECESGRTGSSYYYTFGCIEDDRIFGASYKNGKLYSSDGDLLDTNDIKFDFVSISSKEHYGHPPHLMIFESNR